MPPALRANYDHSYRNDAGYLKAAPVSWNAVPARSGRGKDSLAPMSAPSVTNAKALPAGSVDSAKCLLRYAACA
jgi:hypothetical protein